MTNETALSSVGSEQRTSNSQVVGSSPTGQAIFHPPDLKLIKQNYKYAIHWNYYIEINESLAYDLIKELRARHADWLLVENKNQLICVIKLHRRVADSILHYFPNGLMQRCTVLIQFPEQNGYAYVIKHRYISPPPDGPRANKYLDDRLHNLVEIR